MNISELLRVYDSYFIHFLPYGLTLLLWRNHKTIENNEYSNSYITPFE